MTGGPVPVEELLECIDARERAVVDEAEQVRAEIDALTTRLRELDQEAEHLRITRKTTLGLAAGEPDAGPAPQEPVALPSHPAYRQILAVLTETPGPMRARDLCQALDLPLAPKQSRASAASSSAWSTAASSPRPNPACSPSDGRSRPPLHATRPPGCRTRGPAHDLIVSDPSCGATASL
ncbi:hypothetical protein [Streptomyces sp. NPDC056227]|uniref:hypothetical protein n=1 Tax=Streptomyces sp. NPDC056227 TaxID=3345753 RepID=UPI0035DC16F0